MTLKKLLCTLLLVTASMASGQIIGVNGVDSDGYIGVYDIGGQQYWWLCIEPTGSPAAGSGEAFLANQLSLQDAWDRQNVERFNDYNGDLIAQAALLKQVTVMQYVLDTYLPIDTLNNPAMLPAGSESASRYLNNEVFYNRLNVVQHFMSEMYGKPQQSVFTDLSNFADRWSGDLTDAGIARSALFQSILNDVEGLDAANFFDTYVVQNQYYVANTFFEEGSLDNWQDALIIVAPIPEPSGALLIACCGLAVMLRRWRKLT